MQVLKMQFRNDIGCVIWYRGNCVDFSKYPLTLALLESWAER